MKFKKWLPTAVVMVIIFGVSSIHGNSINSAGFGNEAYHIDGHLLMYVLLGWAVFYATRSIKKTVVFALAYGISDEIHQIIVPMRAFEVLDIFVDTVGGAFGAYLACKLLPLLSKKQNN